MTSNDALSARDHAVNLAKAVARWCEPDDCPASICGGPHHEVRTSLGTEIIRVGQDPIGKPVAEGSAP